MRRGSRCHHFARATAHAGLRPTRPRAAPRLSFGAHGDPWSRRPNNYRPRVVGEMRRVPSYGHAERVGHGDDGARVAVKSRAPARCFGVDSFDCSRGYRAKVCAEIHGDASERCDIGADAKSSHRRVLRRAALARGGAKARASVRARIQPRWPGRHGERTYSLHTRSVRQARQERDRWTVDRPRGA